MLKGNSQIACKRVVANNRVERIFFWGGGQKMTAFKKCLGDQSFEQNDLFVLKTN